MTYAVQIVAAIVSAAVPNDGGRGWTSFVLLIIELNLICIVGWSSERNAGNAVKELEVHSRPTMLASKLKSLSGMRAPEGVLASLSLHLHRALIFVTNDVTYGWPWC